VTFSGFSGIAHTIARRRARFPPRSSARSKILIVSFLHQDLPPSSLSVVVEPSPLGVFIVPKHRPEGLVGFFVVVGLVWWVVGVFCFGGFFLFGCGLFFFWGGCWWFFVGWGGVFLGWGVFFVLFLLGGLGWVFWGVWGGVGVVGFWVFFFLFFFWLFVCCFGGLVGGLGGWLSAQFDPNLFPPPPPPLCAHNLPYLEAFFNSPRQKYPLSTQLSMALILVTFALPCPFFYCEEASSLSVLTLKIRATMSSGTQRRSRAFLADCQVRLCERTDRVAYIYRTILLHRLFFPPFYFPPSSCLPPLPLAFLPVLSDQIFSK